MRQQWAWATFSLVFVLPLAQAASISGDAETDGPLHLPNGRVDATPHAVFLNLSEALSTLTLSAPRLVVNSNDWNLLTADTGASVIRFPAEKQTASYPLDDARLALIPRGDHLGWLGVYPGATATLHFTSHSPYAIQPSLSTLLGNSPSHVEEKPEPAGYYYSQDVTQPHLRLDAAGTYSFTGPGALKLMGPDVEIQSRTNSTRIETGPADAGQPVGTSHERWTLITWETGTLTFTTTAPAEAALATTNLAWTGEASFTATAGELRASGSRYPLTGTPALVTGTFTATLVPTKTRDDAPKALLSLQGDLTDTSLRPVALTLQERALTPTAGLWALGLVLLGTTSGLALALRFRVMRRRIRALEAKLRRSVTEEDAATVFTLDGEPALFLSGVRSRLGDDDRAAADLIRALDTNATWANEVEQRPALAPLLARPDVARAFNAARERAGAQR